MSFIVGIYILFRIIPVIFHSVGIYLLINVKYIKRYQKIQGIYLMWLSIVEITMNLSKIVVKVTGVSYPSFSLYLDVVRTGFFCTQMLLALSAMTIDRAVFVKFNLRYRLKLANKTTKAFIFIAVLFSSLITLIMLLTQTTKSRLSETKTLYYWPINDAFVMFVFMICYASMIHTINKKSKKLYGSESIMYKHRMQKATMVPKLIVVSFIFFWTSADLIYLGFHLADKAVPFGLEIAVNIMVCTAYTTDAVFYIYFCRPIRRVLKKKFSLKKVKQDVCIINGDKATATSKTGNTRLSSM